MLISDWSSDVCSSDLLVRMAERAAEILGEVEPVGQAGEIVEARHAGDLLGRGALFGDVRSDAAKAQIFDLVVEPGRSEARREGTECVSKGRCRWSPYL